ncbi:unnamed protein product [Chrysoparadoxa australica]
MSSLTRAIAALLLGLQGVLGLLSVAAKLTDSSKALVWFTPGDLRTHDHEGLAIAATAGSCVPLFVFDDEELAIWGPEATQYITHAVSSLREKVRGLGSDLVVRHGKAGDEVLQLAKEVQATHLLQHACILDTGKKSRNEVKTQLGDSVEIAEWRTNIYEEEPRNPPSSYKSYAELTRGLALQEPLPTISALPKFPEGIEIGDIPDAMQIAQRVHKGKTEWRHMIGGETLCKEGYGEDSCLDMLNRYVMDGETAFGTSVFGAEAPSTLEAAATSRIIKARGVGGLAEGEVFSRAFGMALSLGCLSTRRAIFARKKGYASNRVAVQRPLTCWATQVTKWRHWHNELAQLDLQEAEASAAATEDEASKIEFKYWTWNGLGQCRYAVGGSTDPDAPVVLMVHGFGGSVEQWTRMFQSFHAEHPGKYRLYALDLIGFGHSAKPPLTYNQYTWSDQVRDFALQVIQKPFFIVGNSIGGFISMAVAADVKDKCKGVVLVNSAGRLLTDKDLTKESKKLGGLTVEEATIQGELGSYNAPPNAVLMLFSQGIFSFLQGRIAKTCKNLYPTNPELVDQGLAANILRDSEDPGAVGVIAAGGKLPLSASANELLSKFGGPVLIAQGLLDPLNDAPSRAEQFKQVYHDVQVAPIQGGHCPHDENANDVAAAVAAFVDTNVKNGEGKPRHEMAFSEADRVVAQ